MPRIKLTIGLLRSVYGPSESYISPTGTGKALAKKIQKLIDLRFGLLSDVVTCVGMRFSAYPDDLNAPGARRKSVFYPPGTWTPSPVGAAITIPAQGSVPNGPNIRPDQSRVCLHNRMTFDGDRSAISYFTFPPDSVVEGEPASYFPDGNPLWANDLLIFNATLVDDGWLIIALSNTGSYAPKPISTWVSSSAAPDGIGFVLPNAPASGITAGKFVKVQGVRRRGTDKLSYNGRYYVDSVNTTLVPDSTVYFLRGTEVGDVTSIKLPGTVKLLGKAYYPIERAEVIRAGVHKRGKSFASPRGRRLSRQSLDP